MPATRKKVALPFSDYFHRSFLSKEVQEVLNKWKPLHYGCEYTHGDDDALAFPITVWAVANEAVLDCDARPERGESFFILRHRSPEFSAEMLLAVTRYHCTPKSEWSLDRALIEYHFTLDWQSEENYEQYMRSLFRDGQKPTEPDLISWEDLQETIEREVPNFRKTKVKSAAQYLKNRFRKLMTEHGLLIDKWKPHFAVYHRAGQYAGPCYGS